MAKYPSINNINFSEIVTMPPEGNAQQPAPAASPRVGYQVPVHSIEPTVQSAHQPAAMNAQRVLIGVSGALAARVWMLGSSVTIGTDPRRAQFCVPIGTHGVSGLHCTVAFDGAVVKVTDENSTYGTWIDDRRLAPNTPTVIHRGQTLYLGSKQQSFIIGC